MSINTFLRLLVIVLSFILWGCSHLPSQSKVNKLPPCYMAADVSIKPTVILVHGLHMNTLWLWPMANKLEQQGYAVYYFAYDSMNKNVTTHGQALAHFIRTLNTPKVNIVTHSLGGLVTRYAVAYDETLPLNRIVTLGTPHQGSQVAAKLSQWYVALLLVGPARQDALLGKIPHWSANYEMASIAGTKSVGLARLVYDFSVANDGVVSVTETQLEGLKAHLIVDSSHTGMLFSDEVTQQVVQFLQCGAFYSEIALKKATVIESGA